MTHEGTIGVGGTARARARAAVMSDILAVARRHLAEVGGVGLSLRAVAREVGMASSAIYRYVASREELITLLVLEAYNSAADSVEEAYSSLTAHDASAQWLTVARAFRLWALKHPQDYSLIYGSPVPGYQAPEDTVVPAIRIWTVLARIVSGADFAGPGWTAVGPFDFEGLLSDDMARFPELVGLAMPADVNVDSREAVTRTITLFSALIGAVSSEMFGHFRGFTPSFDRLFDINMATAGVGVGLTATP